MKLQLINYTRRWALLVLTALFVPFTTHATQEVRNYQSTFTYIEHQNNLFCLYTENPALSWTTTDENIYCDDGVMEVAAYGDDKITLQSNFNITGDINGFVYELVSAHNIRLEIEVEGNTIASTVLKKNQGETFISLLTLRNPFHIVNKPITLVFSSTNGEVGSAQFKTFDIVTQIELPIPVITPTSNKINDTSYLDEAKFTISADLSEWVGASIKYEEINDKNNPIVYKDEVTLTNSATIAAYVEWDGYEGERATETFHIMKSPGIMFYDPGYNTHMVEKTSAEIDFTEREQFDGLPLYNPNQLRVSYTSSNTEVASIDASTGRVTINGYGSTTITATSEATSIFIAGTASYVLTVNDNRPTASITFAESSISKKIGDTPFTNTLTNTGDGSVDYSTDNEKIATVDNNGLVTIVGVGTVHITAHVTEGAINKYPTNTVSYTLTVSPKELTENMVTLSDVNFIYNGNVQKPTVTVRDGNVSLVENTDYTLTNEGGTNAGTYTVTVKGVGLYSGTVSKSFTISANATAFTITLDAVTVTYDGTAKTPRVTVKAGNATLAEGKDFSVSYSNNVNAGTATITVNGSGNYAGSTGTTTFTINPKTITDDMIILSATSFTYNGSAQKPSVTVKDGEKVLTGVTDYTVVNRGGTDVGTYTVTVTGTGNYTGSASKTFTITADATQLSVTPQTTVYTYDGTAKMPEVTVSSGSNTLTDKDYTIAYSNNINVGTATITVNGLGNYAGSTGTATFTINPKAVTEAMITLSSTSFTYSGSTQKPAVTVQDGETVLNEGTDYTVANEGGTDVGIYTVTVKGIGNYSGTISKTFTIAASTTSFAITLETTTYTYDGTAKTPKVSVKSGNTTLTENKDYTVDYSNNINAGTATITVNGSGNYTGSTGATTFTINPKAITDDMIILSATSFTYDGTTHKPSVTLKDGEKVLTGGTDYTVVNRGRTDVGTYTVTVTGKGNYTGSASKTFTITANVTTFSVTPGTATYTYDGTAKTPKVTVTVGRITLSEGNDYTVGYSNNINAGTATITVNGSGNYAGSTGTATFTINPKTVTDAMVTLSSTSYAYNGSTQKPSVTVKDGGTVLTEGTDYTVANEGGSAVGSYTVTVTGKGNYTGSASKTFTITANVTTFSVTPETTTYTYDGTAKTPKVTVKAGSTTLSEQKDYTVSYSNNVNAGTATITVKGSGNYAGSTGTATFTIHPKAVSEAMVTLSSTSFTYNGSVQKPTVTVKDGEKVLVKGTDYTVANEGGSAVGSYTVTVTGQGNYTGNASKTFTITASVTTFSVIPGTTTYTYDGTAKTPKVTVKAGSTTLSDSKDYTVSYSNNVNAGTATITVNGSGNYAGSTGTATFTINPKAVTDAMVTLSSTSFTYNGSVQKPTVTVKDGEKVLKEGTDYTVTNNGGTDAGTYTVTVTGKGNYTGTASKAFIIVSSGNGFTVVPATLDYTYDGTAKTPKVTVKAGNTTLKEGKDYTVSYSNNINAGTATITVNGSGNYAGSTGTATFTINPKAVADAMVTLSSSNFNYNGSIQKPVVTVKDGEKALKEGTDYIVVNEGGTDTGTYTVTVTGQGNYTGEVKKTFTITANASALTITPGTTTYTYDGTAKTPKVTVTVGSTTLSEGKDYTVSYSNNINAGTATITVNGSGNYAGSTGTATFTINPKTVTDAMVTLSSTSYAYNGSTQKPSVTVKDGGTVLKEGTDYTVANEGGSAAGTYTVTVTGKGNYTGSASKTFTITANVTTFSVTPETTTYTYDGTAKTPKVTVKAGSTTLSESKDYTVSYSNNVNAGTATITVNGSGNYTGSTGSATFTIHPKAVSEAMVTLSSTSFTYSGNLQKPTVTVKDGEKLLTEGTDYTVTNEGGTDAGTYTVTVTGQGNYTGTANKSFSINANVTKFSVDLETTSFVYDGTAKTPIVTVKAGNTALAEDKDYTVSYSNNVNAGTATITVNGSGNYAGSTGTATFTINSKTVTDAMVTLSSTSFTYNGSTQKPTVTVKDGEKLLAEGTDYTVANAGGTDAGTYTVTVTGRGNYAGSVSKAFAITASDDGFTVIPSTLNYTYDGVAKTPKVTVTAGNTMLTEGKDYTVDYSNNVNAGTATITVNGSGNYAGSSGTATFTISKAEVSVFFPQDSYHFMLNETAESPMAVTAPAGREVVYSSSQPDIADVDPTTGKLTLKGIGTATITATVDETDNYLGAEAIYIVTVSMPSVADGYQLWIDDLQVTPENQDDVLGDMTDEKAPSIVFNGVNTLVLTNATAHTIVSQLPEGLTVYLIGDNELSSISQYGNNDAVLHFTTDDVIPGKLTLSTEGGSVITGFAGIDCQQHLSILLPEKAVYANGLLADEYGETAMEASVGSMLYPMFLGEKVTFHDADFITYDDSGKPQDIDLHNAVINNVLYTLKSDEGYDDTEGCIVLNSYMSTSAVFFTATSLTPGTSDYANYYYGMTFMVPGGTGVIELDVQTMDNNVLHVQIGANSPIEVIKTERETVVIPYSCEEATYVYVYCSDTGALARPVNRIGKKSTVHVKVYSVSIKPNTVKSTNSVKSVAPNYPNQFTPTYGGQGGTETDGMASLRNMPSIDEDGWYDMSGRRIDTPKKPGLYIRGGKKVVIRRNSF